VINPAAVALAGRIQKEAGVPYVMLDGSLSGIPHAYEVAGDLLGVPERARALASHAARVLADVDAGVARVPADKRPRVYYARGPLGLQTELTESIDRLGAINVATGQIERGALATVSFEQVRGWNPDVIVTIDPGFAASARTDPQWQAVAAAREGRIHLVPLLPFPWLDTPPSVNRLIGLLWLGRALYPGVFPDDLREKTRAFCDLFYQRPLYAHETRALLGEGSPR
jgi:iron complex transport system substrate-binding protein